MIFGKKNKVNKLLYKHYIKLKENLQNKKKLLQFKKKKWKKFKQNYLIKLKQYRKFKLKDQNQYVVSQFPFKGFSYNKNYKNTLQEIKKLKLLYESILKALIKKTIKSILNLKNKKINFLFFKIFEKRLDVVLYRAKFSLSIRNARQLIIHGVIIVNNKIVKTKSYKLKHGDLISINFKYFKLIATNIQKVEVWPLIPKHLTINFKALQIVVGIFQQTNLSTIFSYTINLEKILTSLYKQ